MPTTPAETAFQSFLAIEIKAPAGTVCPTCASRGSVLVCDEAHSFGTLSANDLAAKSVRLLGAERMPCPACRPVASAAWFASQIAEAA